MKPITSSKYSIKIYKEFEIFFKKRLRINCFWFNTRPSWTLIVSGIKKEEEDFLPKNNQHKTNIEERGKQLMMFSYMRCLAGNPTSNICPILLCIIIWELHIKMLISVNKEFPVIIFPSNTFFLWLLFWWQITHITKPVNALTTKTILETK